MYMVKIENFETFVATVLLIGVLDENNIEHSTNQQVQEDQP